MEYVVLGGYIALRGDSHDVGEEAADFKYLVWVLGIARDGQLL